MLKSINPRDVSPTAPSTVAKIPNWAAAPRNRVRGLASSGPKSVIAPTPMNITSGATPLALQKFDQISTPLTDLLTGTVSGSAGETSAIIILLGGIYLAARRMMDWRIRPLCGSMSSRVSRSAPRVASSVTICTAMPLATSPAL